MKYKTFPAGTVEAHTHKAGTKIVAIVIPECETLPHTFTIIPAYPLGIGASFITDDDGGSASSPQGKPEVEDEDEIQDLQGQIDAAVDERFAEMDERIAALEKEFEGIENGIRQICHVVYPKPHRTPREYGQPTQAEQTRELTLDDYEAMMKQTKEMYGLPTWAVSMRIKLDAAQERIAALESAMVDVLKWHGATAHDDQPPAPVVEDTRTPSGCSVDLDGLENHEERIAALEAQQKQLSNSNFHLVSIIGMEEGMKYDWVGRSVKHAATGNLRGSEQEWKRFYKEVDDVIQQQHKMQFLHNQPPAPVLDLDALRDEVKNACYAAIGDYDGRSGLFHELDRIFADAKAGAK